MTEHTYRLVMGILLLIILYTDTNVFSYTIIGIIMFEGLTNLRLNLLVTRLRNKFGANLTEMDGPPRESYRVNFEAERAQRIVVAVSFAALFFYSPDELWMINWMFAFGMLISGIVMFCPIIALFKAVGFK
ncbi:YgaP-like transmembrane domain [Kaarinaea lacus]